MLLYPCDGLRRYRWSEHGDTRLRGERLLRATLAGDEDANSLDHLGGRADSLRQKDVGGTGAVKGCDGARDNHRRKSRVQLFGAAHELVAIHLGHVEIAEEEIKGARYGLLDDLKGVMGRDSRDDAVAARFQQEGADRECLFVVVYAEDRLLRPQSSLASAGGPP